jgi:nucleosome binding factor SPN SPT16 subunit
MKTINENPYEFFREGGWRTFLGGGTAEVRISLCL